VSPPKPCSARRQRSARWATRCCGGWPGERQVAPRSHIGQDGGGLVGHPFGLDDPDRPGFQRVEPDAEPDPEPSGTPIFDALCAELGDPTDPPVAS
jgi:hypothetical protein